jgi:hypothetical protein
LGSAFSGSASVLRALSPYVFLSGLGPVLVMPLNYMGEARRRVPISIATLLVNVAIDIVPDPEFGILGGAVGTDVAYALYVAANLWLCHSLLDPPAGTTDENGGPIARSPPERWRSSSLCSRSLSVFEVARGAAAGTAAFIAVLLLTRGSRSARSCRPFAYPCGRFRWLKARVGRGSVLIRSSAMTRRMEFAG